MQVLDLPFTLHSTFVIEECHGFNKVQVHASFKCFISSEMNQHLHKKRTCCKGSGPTQGCVSHSVSATLIWD